MEGESLMSNIGIRKALLQDSVQIRDIYAPYVEQTAITFETEVPTATEMMHRMEKVLERYPYLVAVDGDTILGYAYAHPFIQRAAYDWSVEMSIYVRADERHQGVGGRLYRMMEDILHAQGILNLNACIAVPQSQADEHLTDNSMKFHEHMGYTLVGRFHNSGYKFGRWYDMVWMEKMIGAHTTPAKPICTYNAVQEKFSLK